MSVAEDETILPADTPTNSVGTVPSFSSGSVDPVPVNYYGSDVTERVDLGDGVQWVEIKEFTEGDRRKYLNSINKDIRVERQSGNAFLHNTAGQDRLELLKVAIVDFYLFKPEDARDPSSKLIPTKFSDHELRMWLDKGSPKVFEKVEVAVRRLNPWLMGDITIEQLQEQIDQLQEMIEVKQKEEAGKES